MELRSPTKAEVDMYEGALLVNRAFVKHILAQIPRNAHEYSPLVGEEDYRRHETKQLVENYFENPSRNLVSFFE